MTNPNDKRYQERQKKKGWHHAVSRAIATVFRILRKIVQLIGELFEHILALISLLFEQGALFWKSPFTHYVAAIVVFLGLMFFALHQWVLIGEFFGRMLKSRGFWVAGLVVGTILNLHQMSPMLWKIDSRIAKTYAKAQIDPHFEPQEEESPAGRLSNWSSHAHRRLKGRASISYAMEWGFYLIYWVVALKFSILGLVGGLIALTMPQLALSFALAQQDIMRQTLLSLDEDEFLESSITL